MKTLSTTLVLAILLAAAEADSAQTWDFSFGYQTVYSPHALDYVTEQVNIKRTSEGITTYWNPIANGREATLTQKFTFSQPTDQAFLHMNFLYMANFGGGNYGAGSLWGSKNGADWVQLLDAPTPSEIAARYSYNGSLPESLMGGSELWIQARLITSGWNIMAQFLRYTDSPAEGRTDNAFDLGVLLQVPEPSVPALLALGVGAVAFRRPRRPGLPLGHPHGRRTGA